MPDQVTTPVTIRMPDHGITLAESIHHPSFRMAWQVDDFYEVFYVVRGRLQIETEEGQSQARAGDFFHVPRGMRHRQRDLETPSLLILCIDGDGPALAPLFGRTCGALARLPRVITPGALMRAELESTLRTLLNEQSRPDDHLPLRSAMLASQVLLGLLRPYTSEEQTSTEERIARLAEHITAQCQDSWTVERACKLCHMSRRHFQRQFRRIVGQPFLQFVISQRVERMAALIEEGSNSIAGAAFAAGFNDLSHAYKLFRRIKGASPGQWRGSEPAEEPNGTNA